MPVKDIRIQEWLEKYRQFEIRSSQYGLKFKTRKVLSRDRVGKKKKWYKFVTQAIRREIARGLGELYDLALKFSKEKGLELKEREKWARLAAYIAQNINTIIDSYDAVRIEQTLEEMKRYVKVHVEEG